MNTSDETGGGLATIVWFMAAAMGAFALLAALCGCAYRGGKVVEGTDLAVGLSVPATEGTIDLNVVNWLSGFRLGVDRNAAFWVRYSTTETNEYFGVVKTKIAKSIEAKIEPTEEHPVADSQP